jgi:hypothetical protein
VRRSDSRGTRQIRGIDREHTGGAFKLSYGDTAGYRAISASPLPVAIVSHAVRLYFRFCLSFSDVAELLLERGVLVTAEAIRKRRRAMSLRRP